VNQLRRHPEERAELPDIHEVLEDRILSEKEGRIISK
jgi:hypothetical protein